MWNKKGSFVERAMKEKDEEFYALQSYFDSRYVKRDYCVENSKSVTEKIDTVYDNVSAISEKVNILVSLICVMSVAVIGIAVKVIFLGG